VAILSQQSTHSGPKVVDVKIHVKVIDAGKKTCRCSSLRATNISNQVLSTPATRYVQDQRSLTDRSFILQGGYKSFGINVNFVFLNQKI
jgi:hypothetical protein